MKKVIYGFLFFALVGIVNVGCEKEEDIDHSLNQPSSENFEAKIKKQNRKSATNYFNDIDQMVDFVEDNHVTEPNPNYFSLVYNADNQLYGLTDEGDIDFPIEPNSDKIVYATSSSNDMLLWGIAAAPSYPCPIKIYTIDIGGLPVWLASVDCDRTY